MEISFIPELTTDLTPLVLLTWLNWKSCWIAANKYPGKIFFAVGLVFRA